MRKFFSKKSLLSPILSGVAIFFLCSYSHSLEYKYRAKWGSGPGSGDGQFNNATGITISTDGKVYVAEWSNHRVQVFTSSGGFVTKWGSNGAGDGQFNGPFHLAIDTAGNVVVADRGNHRIQVFTSTGGFVRKWGSGPGSGDGQFNLPRGVVISTSGNVYIADTNNHRIQVFSSTGGYLFQWGSGPGSGDGQFNAPQALVLSTSGNVYVADSSNQRIQVFTSTGGFLFKWGSNGTGNDQFINPLGISISTSGNVFTVDYSTRRVQVFSSTGGFITKWGNGPSSADGEFNGPTGVAVSTQGSVYVTEFDGHRVQRFSPRLPPPSIPELVSPVDDTEIDTALPTFDWSDSVGDTGGVENIVVTYELQLSTSSNFVPVFIGTNPVLSQFVSTQSLTVDVRYYWRARALGDEFSSWSSTRSLIYKQNSFIQDTDHGGLSWTITQSTTIAGRHTNINIFKIETGVRVTVQASTVTAAPWEDANGNSVGQYGKLEIRASSSQIFGTLELSSAGFRALANLGAGPGGGFICGGLSGTGASYGGLGGPGRDCVAPSTAVYGVSYSTDLRMGSGGPYVSGGSPPLGHGGGALLLVSDYLLLGGTIAANGKDGGWDDGNTNIKSAGGSGGSISIISSTISYMLGGWLSAQGGKGKSGGGCASPYTGSGAGGRIKILSSNSDLPFSAISVAGGEFTCTNGGNGTIFYVTKPTLNSPNWAVADVWFTSVTARWNANGNPSGTIYQIDFATSSDFSSPAIALTSVQTINTSVSSTTLPNLARVAFRVRAASITGVNDIYSSYVVSETTTTKSFTPTLNTPNWASADVIITSAVARWNANNNPTGTTYRVQFATSTDFVGIVTSSDTTSLFVSTIGLLPNTTISFRVQAVYASNNATIFAVSLTTKTGSWIPNISAWSQGDFGPFDGAVRWGPNGNPTGTKYRVQFATSADFDSPGVALTPGWDCGGGDTNEGNACVTGNFLQSTNTFSAGQVGNSNWRFAARVQATYTDRDPSPWAVSVVTATWASTPTVRGYSWDSAQISSVSVFFTGRLFPVNESKSLNSVGTTIKISTGNFAVSDSSSSVQDVGISTLTLSFTAANTTYTVKARAENYMGRPSSEVTVVSSATAANIPIAPIYGSRGVYILISSALIWAADLDPNPNIFTDGNPRGGTTYQIQISSVSDFSSGVILSTTYIQQGAGGVWISGLIPLTVYSARTRAISKIGVPTLFGPTATLPRTLPATPFLNAPHWQNEDITLSSVTARWQANGNPSGTLYRVEFATSTDFAGIVTTSDTYLLSASSAALPPNWRIPFRVQARDIGGSLHSDYAVSMVTATLANPPILNVPNFSDADIGVTSVTARWNSNGNTSTTTYRVQFATSTDFSSSNIALTEFATANLEVSSAVPPNWRIAFRVRAENWTNIPTAYENSVTTISRSQAPAVVSFSVWATSLSVTLAQGDNPTGTTLSISTGNFEASSSSSGPQGAGNTSFTITRLIANTSYTVSVRSLNFNNLPSSTTVVGSTITQTVPFSVAGFQVFTTSVSVTISSGGNPAGTQLVISTGNNGHFAVSLASVGAIAGENTTLILTGLAPNTTYAIQSGLLSNANGSTATIMVTNSTTTLTAPHSVTGFKVFTTSVAITIGSNGNPSGTQIVVSTGSNGDFTVARSSIGKIGGTETMLVIDNLSVGAQYSFQSGSLSSDGSTNTLSVTFSTYTLSVSPTLISFAMNVSSTVVRLGPSSNVKGVFLEVSTSSAFSTDTSSRVVISETCVWNPITEQFDCSADTMSIVLNGLVPNNTNYVLRARAVNPNQSPTNSIVVASTSTFAAVPGAITFLTVGFTSITIQWDSNGNQLTPPTSYQAQISTWSGFSGIVTSSETFDLTASTYNLISGNTYFFRVRAFNRRGGASDWSVMFSTVTQSRVPSVLVFTPAQVGISSIAFSWDANGNPDGTLYRAQVSLNSNFSPATSIETTALSIASTALTANTTYFFRVAASPFSIFSDMLSTATLSISPVIVSAESFVSSVSVAIANNGNPVGTSARVIVSSGDFSSIDFSSSGFIAGPITMLAPQGLQPNTTYTIVAESINHQKLVSSQTIVSTVTLANIPGALSLVEQTISSITIQWTPNSNPLTPPTSYEMQVSEFSNFSSFSSSVTFAVIASTEGLVSNKLYYFRVRAFNRRGVPTAWRTGNFGTLSTLVGVSGFEVFVTSFTAYIQRGGNALGTDIQLSTGTDGNFSVALSSDGKISGDITPLTIFNLSTNTAYAFQTRVVGQTTWTVITVSTYTQSVPPKLVSFSPDVNSISLTLDANTNPSGTVLQVSTDSFTTIAGSGTGTSYTLSLTPNTLHTVYGRSVNQNGSPSSSAVLFSTYTRTAVPSNIQTPTVSFTALKFSWTANGNPSGTSYKAELYLGTQAELIGSQTLTATEITFTNLSIGTNYTFYLRALHQDGSPTSIISLSTTTKNYAPVNAKVSIGTGSYTLSWDPQPDASGFRVRDANNTLIAELSGTATSYSQTGFTENQEITRRVDYFNQFITTRIIDMSFFTAISPPKSPEDVMTILSKTATSMKIRVTPPPNPTGKAGVRIRLIPLNSKGSPAPTIYDVADSRYIIYLRSYKYPLGANKFSAAVPSVGSAPAFEVFPADPPGTIVVDFQDGNWEKDITGLVPGVSYSMQISYLNSDGVESPAGSFNMNIATGFSAEEEGIKAANEKFIISEGVDFVVASNSAGNGTIKVYGVNQNLVRSISFTYNPGFTRVKWDGKDDTGQPVFTDVYWVVMETQHFGKKTVNVAGIR